MKLQLLIIKYDLKKGENLLSFILNNHSFMF